MARSWADVLVVSVERDMALPLPHAAPRAAPHGYAHQGYDLHRPAPRAEYPSEI